jgi:hypothetical protein
MQYILTPSFPSHKVSSIFISLLLLLKLLLFIFYVWGSLCSVTQSNDTDTRCCICISWYWCKLFYTQFVKLVVVPCFATNKTCLEALTCTEAQDKQGACWSWNHGLYGSVYQEVKFFYLVYGRPWQLSCVI